MVAISKLQNKYVSNLSTYLPISYTDVTMLLELSRLALKLTNHDEAAELVYDINLAQAGIFVATGIYGFFLNKFFLPKISVPSYENMVQTSISIDDQISRASSLIEGLNEKYTPNEYSIKDLSKMVNEEVTKFQSDVLGVDLHYSNKIRQNDIMILIRPSSVSGVAEPIQGEISIRKKFRNTAQEPMIIAHEMWHRRHYSKELDAQLLAYFSLINSDERVLQQSAEFEETTRLLYVLRIRDKGAFDYLGQKLNNELIADYNTNNSKPTNYGKIKSYIWKPIYLGRKKLFRIKEGSEEYTDKFVEWLHNYRLNSETANETSKENKS